MKIHISRLSVLPCFVGELKQALKDAEKAVVLDCKNPVSKSFHSNQCTNSVVRRARNLLTIVTLFTNLFSLW